MLPLSSMTPRRRAVLAAGAALALGLLVVGVCLLRPNVREVPGVVFLPPTDTVLVGTLDFAKPGTVNAEPRILHQAGMGIDLETELVLDEHSVCAAPNGAAPCMAMSVTLDVPFDGKRAVVEGNLQDGRLLVRKLRALEAGEEPRPHSPGTTYVSWPHAVRLIEACQPSFVGQSHALDVDMTLKDGRRVRAVEPTIDEVFRVVERTRDACGQIPVATE
jgi:hypothetical protein